MNYIGCFNRSRAANCLQPVFFVPGAPQCCQVWSVARCTFCARPGAFLVPTLLRYTYYSISQILELFAVDPTPGSSL